MVAGYYNASSFIFTLNMVFEYVKYSIGWGGKSSDKNTIKNIRIVLEDIK